MHEVVNNNSPKYLAQLFISHQSHYTNSRNNLYVPRPRLDLFETSISFAGESFWNSLPQNIKSCISIPCFKRNLYKYMSENNLSSNLVGFVWITRLPKNIECCIHVCPWKKFYSDVFAHLQELWNCINQLLNRAYNICLWYCRVYSKDWLLGPNGPNATILGY